MTRYLTTLALALATGLGLLAGSYSAFTDSGSANVTTSAGSLDIFLGPGVLLLNGGCEPLNLVPGSSGTDDECTGIIQVFNGGTVDLTYTHEAIDTSEDPGVLGPGVGCFIVDLVGPNKHTTGINPQAGVLLANTDPPDEDRFTVKVRVKDDNDCQGEEAQVGIKVEATQWP